MKSRLLAILLCLSLGWIGVHRFYLGYTFKGLIQLLTFGGFGIWAFVDFIRLLTGSLGPEGSVWKEEEEKERIEEEKERIEEEKEEKEEEKESRKRDEKEKEEREEREERMKKEEEENKKRMEWEREFDNKLANISAEEAIDFLEKEFAGGNLSSTKHSYLERIVSKKKREEERRKRAAAGFIIEEERRKREEEKIRKEKERIQKKEDFFPDNKLTILPNGNIRDENWEEYELEEERGDFIVYKPEGMKGKRAYIKTDGEKNYLAWSGPIKIADKSNFLRGDFEKAKEESQPKEEATVQGQEVENIEVKQEKELESSDANLDITARLNKITKLYEDGKLTKEEYQQKTNVLISQI